MPDYLMLCYQEEIDTAELDRREREVPAMLELFDTLREEGLLLDVQCLQDVDTATTVTLREGELEIVDGPFAVTKEMLAGYYLMRCADLDDALAVARRLPSVVHGRVEIRPLAPSFESRAAAVLAAEGAEPET